MSTQAKQTAAEIRDQMMNEVIRLREALRGKLKAGLDAGPDGEPVVLTTAEATIAYRMLFERL